MESIQRVTAPTVDVLRVLLNSTSPVWGLQIIKKTERLPGTVYPILERLERQGWIRSSWEEDSSRQGPRRKLYEFTADGAAAARETCLAFDAKQAATGIPETGRLATS
ncbi:Transcriptional regulator PadR-like family protein [Agreia bicolorata]|uniref:Transcriptional regulator PadR-like family protein n=1 Tax=Agreia bicolorata TaxID=110935 RepID=A0A1T4YIH4_9MICO|nr:PadR family transcriptional regulator [Agreia bicolorata]SKB01589.1 Transcriptional regulator PadR-like family protein [Agreia bicolorata]